MKNGKIQVGFVGVGNISGIYLKNITNMFKEIEIIGVCDLVREKAEKAVEEYNIPKLYNDMYELFADEDVDIVLNITRPYEHYEVTKAALMAGKHVYSEKPLSPDLEEGKELVKLAKKKGLLLGGAPDTFMGAGIQTCRKLIDDGYIGRPIGANIRFSTHGPEDWHPDCEFVYQYGGGPMLDMGPYYVTSIINLLGPVKRINGVATKANEQRPMLCGPKYGNMMSVDVPTYVMGTMEFQNGAVANIFTTFDVYSETTFEYTVYGTDGSISVPDPNTFGGPVKLLRKGMEKAEEIPLVFHYPTNSRALGLADMAKALTTGRDFRANCDQQLHVLEVMTGFIRSSEEGKPLDIEAPFERKAAMDANALEGILEA